MAYIPQNVGTFKTKLAGITSANSSFTLPANAFLQQIFVLNNNGNAITGGLKFGTTNGATDIAAALAVGGSALVALTNAAMLKQVFSSSQQIFIDAVAAWNSANVDITFVYGQL